MDYPDIYTIWVVRNGKAFLINYATTKAEALEIGNRTVSTRDFVIKAYSCKDVQSASSVVSEAPAEMDLSKVANISTDD